MLRVGSILGVIAIVCSLRFVGIGSSAVPTDRNHRPSRETAVYNIDVLVLTDYAVYKSWYERTRPTDSSQVRRNEALQNIKRYFTLVMREVSEYYSRLQTDFRLKVKLVGFYIVETEISVLWTLKSISGRVDASSALIRLQSWLQNTTNLPAYDHAMLFTGEDLATDDAGHTTGRATVGTMCNGDNHRSVSVIEDRGAFQSVSTAVHELGHSLNATHDGVQNACSLADRYVMAMGSGNVTDSNRRQPWFFSTCSVTEIDNFVKSSLADAQSADCFRTALTGSDVPDVTRVIPGQLYDADIQCQHLHGPQSSLCFFGNLSEICTAMSCKDPTDALGLRCLQHVAAMGTTCGNKQWCQVGECVGGSTDAPVVDDTCYRDQTTRVNGLTCSQMANDQPVNCYNPEVYQQCCVSCKQIDTRVQGCPYGNRKGGCSMEACKKILSNGTIVDEDCCGTCNFDSSAWTCADAAEVDGMPCSVAVQRGGIQGCYNLTLAYHCCAACENQRDLRRNTGCEYGDLLLNGCPASSAGSTGECDLRLCCNTCGAKVTDSGSKNLFPHIMFVAVFVSITLLLTMVPVL